jgi:phosphodiesterase/alkaline phosphatase D-like protein
VALYAFDNNDLAFDEVLVSTSEGSGTGFMAVGKVFGSTPTLTHGPYLGAVTDHTIKIWGRTSDATSFGIRYRPLGTSTWSDPVEVSTDATRDYTGIVKLGTDPMDPPDPNNPPLSPDTTYEYIATVYGQDQRDCPATFKTLPPKDEPGTFTFTVAADFKAEQKPYENFRHMRHDAPDFTLLLGDYFYTNLPSGDDPNWLNYRNGVWADDSFRAYSQRFPSFATWDDHDFGGNNYAGGQGTTRYVRSRNGFDDYLGLLNPDPLCLDDTPAASLHNNTPGELHQWHKLYYSFQVGQAEFFMLDTRSYRSTAARTMLGDEQEAAIIQWLDDSMMHQNTKFRFMISSGMWSAFVDGDGWQNFGGPTAGPEVRKQRERIFRHIVDKQIPGVVLLSGDVHWALVNRLDMQSSTYVDQNQLQNPASSLNLTLFEFNATPTGAFQGSLPQGVTGPGVLYASDDDGRVFATFKVTTYADATPATLEFTETQLSVPDPTPNAPPVLAHRRCYISLDESNFYSPDGTPPMPSVASCPLP